MLFSIIIPVYNRPNELDELLKSITSQYFKDFEVLVIDDGSSTPCKDISLKYSKTFKIEYFFKQNSGPGQSRNYGADRSQGEYLIILDSDCILPPAYLEEVKNNLEQTKIDAFGGPDRADNTFTTVQKAINYSMTSFFTTGGIRGGSKKKLDKFYPRSFNMGIRKDVFTALGGFSKMRFGEDIDFSIRLIKAGYLSLLFNNAWVYHKRRTDFKKFFKQVYNSGIARINLYKKYPDSLKPVHLLPSLFTTTVICLLLLSFVSPLFSLLLLLYTFLIFIDSSIKNKNIIIGFLSIIASFIQLIGYGSGFIYAWWERCIKRKNEFEAFTKNFYK